MHQFKLSSDVSNICSEFFENRKKPYSGQNTKDTTNSVSQTKLCQTPLVDTTRIYAKCFLLSMQWSKKKWSWSNSTDTKVAFGNHKAYNVDEINHNYLCFCSVLYCVLRKQMLTRPSLVQTFTKISIIVPLSSTGPKPIAMTSRVFDL